VELSLVPTEPTQFDPAEDPMAAALAPRVFAPFPAGRAAQVHVRHVFPPHLHPAARGALVLVQPGEYGYLPNAWIEPIRENVREVWCYSHYVRDVYKASGIPEEKLVVVPLGVDERVFSPEAPPYVFTDEPGVERGGGARGLGETEPVFTFLFVGGTLHRKGIDILLEAYLKAFSAYDSVRLVIKDTGTETVYRGQNAREQILPLTGDATRPRLLYLERDLTAHQMASLYAAADCLVQPYRGEGFCLPALEALACGVPVLVPDGGPTDDFVDEAVGWRVSAAKKPFGEGRIGAWDCAGETWMFEVAPEDLARQMRQIAANAAEAKQRGQAGAERVRSGWTWRHSAEVARERLQVLAATTAAEATKETHARPVAASRLGDSEAIPPRFATPPSPSRRRNIEVSGPKNGSKPDAAGAPATHSLRRPEPVISLCLIVKNEERVLGDCLASATPYVDEVIVVDTGSTDRTVEIAKGHKARVFHFPWCDDFSAARNVSLGKATGDWLFWMDADDTLPQDCGERLRDLALLAEDETAGFLMQVHIPPAPGEHGFTVVDHVKLFRNRPEHRFEGRIHEQILESISRAGGRVHRSDLYVIHSGYDYSPEGQKKKRERDLLLLEKDRAERPNHPFVWFNIGMTAFHLKDFEKAVPALQKCLSLAGPRESIVRKVYAMLSGAHLENGDIAAARIWLEKGLALFPHDPELLFRSGIIYRDLGDLAAAERSYLTLLTAREVGHIDSLDVTMTGYKAHHNLALIYQDIGRLAEAEAAFQAAVADAPAFVPSWLGLGELYLRQGRVGEALTIAARMEVISAPEAAEILRQRAQAAGVSGVPIPKG
jgi:glycosyltransferase involved in cell wall biosynthesis